MKTEPTKIITNLFTGERITERSYVRYAIVGRWDGEGVLREIQVSPLKDGGIAVVVTDLNHRRLEATYDCTGKPKYDERASGLENLLKFSLVPSPKNPGGKAWEPQINANSY